jgi:hypothetical protein
VAKLKRQHKACVGCESHFTTFRNYDYCANCAINGSRYIPRQSKCPECGDGSGWIKFPGQPKRPCKLCVLTKKTMPNLKKTKKKPVKLTTEEIQEQKEEVFWEQVDLQAQEKIYSLLTKNIPFQNIKLITEPYRYEDAQQKKVGLFLRRDVDYRTLLVDLESQYDEDLPDSEVVVEEIVLWYCRMVMKSLITDLSDYSDYDPSYFENLTN